MNKHYIGIDPGKHGGIVVIDSNKNFISKHVIPMIGDDIDLHEFYHIFQVMKRRAELDGCQIHVCREQVHAIFGSAAGSTFTFGYVVGLIDMMIVSEKLSFSKLQPKEWQASVWLESEIEREPDKKSVSKNGKEKTTKGKVKTKIVSLKAAKRLFPSVQFHSELKNGKFAKNPHDGWIDAILIAEACRRLNH